MIPCLSCGEPTTGTRCPDCTPGHRAANRGDTTHTKSTTARGYGTAWTKLSRRARKAQPWCLDCGTREDLTTDHSPAAWARHDAGKPIRLDDVDVVCRACNTRRGAARGPHARATQGGRPAPEGHDLMGGGAKGNEDGRSGRWGVSDAVG